MKKSEMKQYTVRVEKNVAQKAESVFSKQGLDLQTAIRIFLTKTANENKIPLNIAYDEQDVLLHRQLSEAFDRFVQKVPGKRVDLNNPDDIAEFFDEDFPEYKDAFKEDSSEKE